MSSRQHAENLPGLFLQTFASLRLGVRFLVLSVDFSSLHPNTDRQKPIPNRLASWREFFPVLA